eukprot:Skav210847  [mRNA]  locus=scaffold2829:105217:106578:- [translate_table: standard]
MQWGLSGQGPSPAASASESLPAAEPDPNSVCAVSLGAALLDEAPWPAASPSWRDPDSVPLPPAVSPRVPYSKSLLYDDEHQTYKKEFPDQFRYDYAVSREEKNAAGQKMYIQTKMAEYAEEMWELMQDKKTHVYMCGLKGMESGMAECFGPIAEKNGLVWAEFAKAMKKADRYHVEVY